MSDPNKKKCDHFSFDLDTQVRGVHVVALAAGPAHALYFSCYERMKIILSGNSQAGHSPLANGVAGCFATLLHDALMVPADGKSYLK